MKKLFFIIPIAFSFLSFKLSNNEENATTYPPFAFVQISDPQFGFSSNYPFPIETANFEKAISKINKLMPAFIVITGDFVNNMPNQSQIDQFQKVYHELDPRIPGYLVPGNHDTKTAVTETTLNNYINIFGVDRYSFQYNGWKFIVLNTTIIKNPDNVQTETAAQLSWLQNELTTFSAGHIMIFQHYPVYLKTPTEADNYYNFPLTVRPMYLNLFNQYVKAVFSGHLHDNLWLKYNNVTLITTNNLCKKPGQTPTAGVRIVKVYKDRYEQGYYPLDSIPSTITF